MKKKLNKKNTFINIFIFVVFVACTLFWAHRAGYLKLLTVYKDELIYYAKAQNFAQGRGMNVIYGNEPYKSERYVYSLALSFAFFFKDRIIQAKLIALINSAIYFSGIFPIALLGKKYLKAPLYRILSILEYVIAAHIMHIFSFRIDPILSVVALWLFYFMFSYVKEKKEKYIVLFAVFSIISILIKRGALIIIAACLASVTLYIIFDSVKNKNKETTKKLLIFGLIFVAVVLLISHIFGLDEKAISTVVRIAGYIKERPHDYMRQFLYYFGNLGLCVGLLPMSMTLFMPQRQEKEGKTLWLAIYFIVVVFTGVQFLHGYNKEVFNPNSFGERYIMYVEPIIFIMFFKILETKEKIKGREYLSYIFILLVSIYIATRVWNISSGPPGAFLPLIYISDYFPNYHLLFQIVVILLALMAFIFRDKYKWVLSVVVIILFAITQRRSIELVQGAMNDYKISEEVYENVRVTEEFIQEHKEDNILIVHNYEDALTYEYVMNMSNRIADTFLNYKNTIHASDIKLMKAIPKGKTSASLDKEIISVALSMTEKESKKYAVDHIDYILVARDAYYSLNEEQCEKVEVDGSYFEIYKINNPKELPLLIKNSE